LGFEKIYVSSFNKIQASAAIQIIKVGKVEELFSEIFA
jgi:hypothetical protein